MFGLEKLLGYPLGWVMYFVYLVVRNYGVAIILFTLITKALLFPISYNQQKSTVRMQSINPKLEKLKKSYANNPQKYQEEQMRVYSEEGINPMASCFPMLIQFAILFGVLDVVYRPLTHILRFSSDTIDAAKSIVQTYMTTNNITDKYFTSRPELSILEYAKTSPELFSSLDGFSDKVVNFNNTMFGINLGSTPTINPEGGWTAVAVGLALIPILSGIIQLLLTIYTQIKQKQNNPNMPSMGAMNTMLYVMPIFSVWFAFQVPAGVGFYWVISSLFSFAQAVALNTYFTPERTEKVLAKDKEKNKKKKPGFMNRMMEQAQQQQTTPNGRPTRISDEEYEMEETKGMSRSEIKEYNRQRINEARQRMAEKYGDDYNDKSDE